MLPRGQNVAVRVHFEGPLCQAKEKGAQNPSVIRPATVEELESVLSDIVMLTMAPEIKLS